MLGSGLANDGVSPSHSIVCKARRPIHDHAARLFYPDHFRTRLGPWKSGAGSRGSSPWDSTYPTEHFAHFRVCGWNGVLPQHFDIVFSGHPIILRTASRKGDLHSLCAKHSVQELPARPFRWRGGESSNYFGFDALGCLMRTLTPIRAARRRISAKTFSCWLGF